MPPKEVLQALAQAVIAGDSEEAKRAAEEAMAAGVDPLEAVKQGVMNGTETVGRQFQELEIFLPELIRAAEAAKAAMAALMPCMSAENRSHAILGKVLIGTVSGDVHDIGKNLVSAVLSANGFEVHDLGIDVPPQKFIEMAKETKADIIALSSLLSTSLPYQKDVIERLKDGGHRGEYYVIVGGGPVTREWAAKIGADGYGRDASGAAVICKQLLSQKTPPPLPEPVFA